MRRYVAIVMLASALPTWAQGRSEDEAGDVAEVDKDSAGLLRDRIRPVTGHRLLMAKRFELTPGLGVTFRDPFFTKVVFELALTWHFNEALALSLDATYNLSLITPWAQICVPQGSETAAGCRQPTMDELTRTDGSPTGALQNRASGLLTFWADLNLQWSPIYGRLSTFAEGAAAFNFYGFIGPSVVMYGPLNQFAPGGNVGIGMRLLFNRWLGLRLQFRDVIYPEQVFQGATQSTSVRNQLMFELGFSMFLPTTFQEKR